MSIYCSYFDFDNHEESCRRMKKRKGYFEYRESERCTCLNAPIKYQGSHIFPHDLDERDGDVGFAAIPSHITRDGRDDQPEGKWHPWLRFHLSADGQHPSVVLTKVQVERLRDELNRWLEDVIAAPNTGEATAGKRGEMSTMSNFCDKAQQKIHDADACMPGVLRGDQVTIAVFARLMFEAGYAEASDVALKTLEKRAAQVAAPPLGDGER